MLDMSDVRIFYFARRRELARSYRYDGRSSHDSLSKITIKARKAAEKVHDRVCVRVKVRSNQ